MFGGRPRYALKDTSFKEYLAKDRVFTQVGCKYKGMALADKLGATICGVAGVG